MGVSKCGGSVRLFLLRRAAYWVTYKVEGVGCLGEVKDVDEEDRRT